MSARIDELQRAVSAVITEARQRTGEQQSCDAAAVVAERAAFWAVLAEDQDRRMDVDLAPGPLPVRVGAAELGACVDHYRRIVKFERDRDDDRGRDDKGRHGDDD